MYDFVQVKCLGVVQVIVIIDKGYCVESLQVDMFGSFGNVLLYDMFVLVMVIICDQFDDCQLCMFSELVWVDVVVGDNYVLVGYYQNLVICGFVLDFVIVYCFNDMIINGEQFILLEDKQWVEIFKGLGGLEVGIVVFGGLVNYVSKCLVDVCIVMLGIDLYGLCYVVVDIGGWLSFSFGVCVNVVYEDMYFYVWYMFGCCSFFLLVVDWKISECVMLDLDSNYQISG